VKDIGLLHDVLGLAVVAKNAAGDAVKPAVVPQRDRPHGSLIAQTRPNQQFLIAETFWLVWQWNWMHAGFPIRLLAIGCSREPKVPAKNVIQPSIGRHLEC
jgi:hypothetical protein